VNVSCMCFIVAVLNACLSGPCLNGGTCTGNGGGSYTCDCLSGWTGQICDQGWCKILCC
jgi:hypothetical protein